MVLSNHDRRKDSKSHELHMILDRFVSYMLQLLSTDPYTKPALSLIQLSGRISQLTLRSADQHVEAPEQHRQPALGEMCFSWLRQRSDLASSCACMIFLARCFSPVRVSSSRRWPVVTAIRACVPSVLGASFSSCTYRQLVLARGLLITLAC